MQQQNPPLQQTRNALSENIRAQSGELLNKHLAAAIDLHAQMKQAHWNVRGPGFIAIHELFDKVSVVVEDFSDQVAGALAAFGQSAREAVGKATEFGDVDTADLFTEISRGIDRQLWFVESHVARK